MIEIVVEVLLFLWVLYALPALYFFSVIAIARTYRAAWIALLWPLYFWRDHSDE